MLVQRDWYIQKRIQDTHDVIIWQVIHKNGEIFDYKPGQFAMIHIFNSDGTVLQKKPYSMSSCPLQKNYLEFGFKIHGNFTQKMGKLLEGDTVGLTGPYGVFTYDKDIHKNLVIFSGGIGITPFISIIRFATEAKSDNSITMFYCNKSEYDIAYKSAVETLKQQNKNLKIIYSVDETATQGWEEDIGFINEVKICKHIDNFDSHYYFLCGPMPFMKSVESILLSHNVARDRIKREIF